jgi:DNA repair protein RadA/Sms
MMNLVTNQTQFKSVSEIEIPSIFYRRYKSGINVVDDLFGEGILPGSSITMCAAAGCGKTTFLLQVLDALAQNGYSTAYASGEENEYQLAFTCNRIGVKQVQVANMTDVDTLAEQMEHFDCLVVDSFQALTSDKKMNTREFESYAISKLTKAAKDTECTIFFIMHLTKDGKLKGSTLVPHSVDVNMQIEVDADVDENARKIYFNKNRFGACNELTVYLGARGYDFNTPVVIEEEESKAPSKKSRKNVEQAKIMTMNEPPHITTDRVMKELDIDYSRASFMLRDLVNNNMLVKFGRGKTAIYKIV